MSKPQRSVPVPLPPELQTAVDAVIANALLFLVLSIVVLCVIIMLAASW